MRAPASTVAFWLLLAAAPSPGFAEEPVLGLAAEPASGPSAAGGARPVYRLHPLADAITMGTAALATVVPGVYASEIIVRRCPCDPGSVNRFDRHAIGNHSHAADAASGLTVVAAMALPPLLDALDVGWSEALGSDAVVFGEALLVNGALVTAVKYTVQRPLPLTYAGDRTLESSPNGYRSFYSGHTSGAFAALTAAAYTARLRHGEHVWPWVVAVGVGASVAVERVLAGRHFPSDVIVGALAGSAVGIGVPWLHTVRPGVAIVPAAGGIGVVASF